MTTCRSRLWLTVRCLFFSAVLLAVKPIQVQRVNSAKRSGPSVNKRKAWQPVKNNAKLVFHLVVREPISKGFIGFQNAARWIWTFYFGKHSKTSVFMFLGVSRCRNWASNPLSLSPALSAIYHMVAFLFICSNNPQPLNATNWNLYWKSQETAASSWNWSRPESPVCKLQRSNRLCLETSKTETLPFGTY